MKSECSEQILQKARRQAHSHRDEESVETEVNSYMDKFEKKKALFKTLGTVQNADSCMFRCTTIETPLHHALHKSAS